MSRNSFRSVSPRPALQAITIPLLLAVCGSAASAAVTNWTNPLGGIWSLGTNWDNGAPTNNTFDAVIGLGGPYTVTLDNNFTIHNFDLSGANTTFQLFDGVNSRTLTIEGDFSQGDTTQIVGDTINVVRSGVVNVLGNTTFHGGQLHQVLNFNANGNLTFSAKSPIDVDDTDVGHSGTTASWVGNNDITLNNSTLSFTGANSTFTISNSQSLIGTGTSAVTLGATARLLKAAPGATTTTGVAVTNTGTIEVGQGTFATDGVSTPANTLTGGKWIVRAASTLDFTAPGQQVVTNQADVTLDGAGSTFAAFDKVQTNAAAGKITISNSRNFTTDTNFTNTGQLNIGTGTDFKVKTGSSLTNISGGTITGGDFRISGRLLVDAADIINVASKITLDGAAAQIADGTNTALNGLRNAAAVNSGGEINLKNGNAFTQGPASFSVDSGGTFDVATTAKLTIPAAKTFTAQTGSTFANIAATTTGGEIVVGGTLKTPTAAINTIGSKITLDGAGGGAATIINNSNANALGNLSTVNATGEFTVKNKPSFVTNTAAFDVQNGGHLTVGSGVNFDIPSGTLANFITGNILDLGRFTLQGRIRTNLPAVIPNFTVNNTTTLDGPGSSIYDITSGFDLFTKLNVIETGGDLSLLNGRALTLTQPLTVRGRLFIGTTPPAPRPGSGTSHDSNTNQRGANTYEVLAIDGDLTQESGFTALDTGEISLLNSHHYKIYKGGIGGNGRVRGNLDMGGHITTDTAMVAPGMEGVGNVGTFQVLDGTLKLDLGSVLQFDLITDAPTAQSSNDLLSVVGLTSIVSGVHPLVSINIGDSFVPQIGAQYKLADLGIGSGLTTSSFFYEGLTKSNGITLSPFVTGNQELYVVVTGVPAPTAAGLLGLTTLMGLRRRR